MLNNRDIIKTEIINGVTVDYYKPEVTSNPQLNKFLQLESIKFYDNNGNEFYANCNDINEAYEQMGYLLERGVAAVIGPKAPIKDLNTGCISANYNENGVAIYIVKKKEKNKGLVKKKILEN